MVADRRRADKSDNEQPRNHYFEFNIVAPLERCRNLLHYRHRSCFPIIAAQYPRAERH